MRDDVKELWVAALRSGDYKQTRGRLHRPDDDPDGGGYCCLGVLCEVAIAEGVEVDRYDTMNGFTYDGEHLVLPGSVRIWAGLDAASPGFEDRDGRPQYLDNTNDNGTPFSVIADIIEYNL